MKNEAVKNMTAIGLITAVIIILSYISIPMPSGVPITLQTFAIAFTGYLLGYKRGVAAICVYILLGAVGIPVFSGIKSGIGVLFSVTGGFIWGFVPMAFLCGLPVKNRRIFAIFIGVAGLAVCHVIGAAQFAAVGGIPFIAAFAQACAPYIIKDILSVIAAYYLSVLLLKRKIFSSK